MTPQDAARVISAFHGAFPHVEVDDSVAAVWASNLAVADYGYAMRTAEQWIQTSTWWPTIAEFNRMMRGLRDSDAARSDRRLPEADPPVDVDAAAKAFERGYRKARSDAGDPAPHIDAKADTHLRRFPSVPGVG